jgi:uroporphyrinogen-III synthase
MLILVTRPAPQALAWTNALCAQGLHALALPLMAIHPSPNPQEVINAWYQLALNRLVVFASPNAVHQFFALQPQTFKNAWPAHLDCACMGPGTQQALRDQGLPESQIIAPALDSMQFDSEALWQQLKTKSWANKNVLVIKAQRGREWLTHQLIKKGAKVSAVTAYQTTIAALDAPKLALINAALQNVTQHLWFFSSSQALDYLKSFDAQIAWHDVKILVTHPRIAEHARSLGFDHIHETHPAFEAVASRLKFLTL